MKTVLSLALVVSCALSQAQLYRCYPIPSFGGSTSTAHAISNSGIVVGSAYTNADAAFHAFKYSLGTLVDLGTLGGTNSAAFGINSLGEIVGESNMQNDLTQDAFSYSGGSLTDLGSLGGGPSQANAVNTFGSIVGSAVTTVHNTDGFVYSGGSMRDLGTLGGVLASAQSINSSGQIVGWSYLQGGTTQEAFLYSNSLMTDLGTLGGAGGSMAYGINDAGQIVGKADTPSHSMHAFLYQSGAMTDLGTLGGTFSEGDALNHSGTVVGRSLLSDGATQHAFIYQNGTMQDLNSMMDSTGAGVQLQVASGINDHGYICGTSIQSGLMRAFELVPYYVVQPTAYNVTTGMYISGQLTDLYNIDQSYLCVRSGPSMNGNPPLQIVITGTSQVSSPTDIRLMVTNHVDSASINQTIEFYDYINKGWTLYASNASSLADTIQTAFGSSYSRFVQAGTNQMMARISFTAVGPISKSPWSTWIDQAIWNVSP